MMVQGPYGESLEEKEGKMGGTNVVYESDVHHFSKLCGQMDHNQFWRRRRWTGKYALFRRVSCRPGIEIASPEERFRT